MSWKRPEHIPYPKYWCSFNKVSKDGKNYRFAIYDATETDHEFLVDKICEGYIREEPVVKAFGVANDEESLESTKGFLRHVLNDRATLICFELPMTALNDNEKFAGCIVNSVKRKGVPDFDGFEFKGEQLINECKFYDYVAAQFDVYDHFKTEEFMSSGELYIPPKYRGMSLSEELMKASLELGKAAGVKLAVARFTNIATQITAKRVGYKEVFEINYADAKRENPQLDLSGFTTKSLKIMYKQIL